MLRKIKKERKFLKIIPIFLILTTERKYFDLNYYKSIICFNRRKINSKMLI